MYTQKRLCCAFGKMAGLMADVDRKRSLRYRLAVQCWLMVADLAAQDAEGIELPEALLTETGQTEAAEVIGYLRPERSLYDRTNAEISAGIPYRRESKLDKQSKAGGLSDFG